MLTVSGLHAGYGKIQILSGVNLKADPGKITAVLGGNGTGKSTLLKAISGLITPWRGTIEFNGERIDGMRPDKIVRLGLSQVTQGKEVYPAMSVEENIRVGAYVRSNRREIADDFERVYSYFPILKAHRKVHAGTLSGGQLQMLCIGRGLMARPKMIMLDEPSSALAPQVVLEIFHSVDQIRRDGTTVLLVEQNVRMALLLAHFGYVIKDGVVHMQGEADALIKDDNVRLSYLGGTLAKAEGSTL
jgi:branched-chain amino acid transport system ATP-binding protein